MNAPNAQLVMECNKVIVGKGMYLLFCQTKPLVCVNKWSDQELNIGSEALQVSSFF